MKKTVEFQIGAETRIRITRYSGTGRVNVHLLTTNWGMQCIYKFACSVGDLSEDVQAQLEYYDMGKTRDRRTKYKYSKAWQEKGFLIDVTSPITTEQVLKR